MQDGNDRQLQLQPMPSTSFSRAVQDYRAHCFADSFRETFGEQAIRGSNVISSAEEDESDDEVVVVESTVAEVPEWFLAKGKVPFHRKPIQAGRECIVLALTPSRKWSPAKILGIIHNVRNKENRCAVVFSGLEIVRDNVPVSEIAYAEECPNLIPVGTSVVSNVLAESPTRFYAGIVIEAPSHSNRYRYLVCFESGAFSYANHNDLRVTCSHFSPRISRNESKLIRKIMSSAAHREQMNRVLLRFKIGEITELLHNGNYEPGTVVAKDCSLVEIRIDNRLEWVYRGSHRFKAMLTTSLRLPGTRPPFGMLHGTQNQAMIGWRGSQSPPNEQPVVLSSTKNKVEPLKLVTPLFVYGCVPKKKGFHRCDESCVVSADIIATIPKHYGPLLKPLCIGFERPRHPVTGPRRYIAPCGRVITNVEQLTSFFEETKVDFTHENFHFSSDIDVQRVYEPRNVLVSIADLSNGLEKCAISCVNEVSDTLPCENFTYETERSFAHGPAELMNTDGNFVSCCSCEDDCSDYLKCECRQLTINSSCETNDPNIPLGYKYGRLENLVRTGIYECNARCPCSAKCQNRVAQLPLRNQLQVFFAGKKGWGVRTLHDLPKGTFVCAYVGKLMTEKEANEWGSLHGDEYFADLDFIKARESGKPGYEEEAYEPEPDPAPESSAPARPTRKRRNRNTAPCPPKRKKRKRKLAAFPPDSIRRFYQPGREEFVMDAKTNGNIGRFFNHSCAPNMFVQNVFVDTHDLRFPWVAFFTQRDVSAGEELTWDYNYTVGSVRGKRLDCYCLAPNCKFRLY